MTTADLPELPSSVTPEAVALAEKLPRCEVCGTPQLTSARCLYCRAGEAEARLAQLSFWGDDDWMRRIASLTLEAQREPDRLIAMGFYQSPIPDRTYNVSSRPQIRFRPEWLTIAPECADMGLLLDVRIGNRSQLVDATALPLSVFSPSSWGSFEAMRAVMGRFTWDVAEVAQDITLCVDFTPAAQYDPLTQIALEAVGRPRPTAFKAVLWGRSPIDEPAWRPPLIVTAGPENVSGIASTLQFADILTKIRAGNFGSHLGDIRGRGSRRG